MLARLLSIVIPFASLALLPFLATGSGIASILLGHCSKSTDTCNKDVKVYGDPSWDQGVSQINDKGEDSPCIGFKSISEYSLKMCACPKCTGCPGSQCEEAPKDRCVGAFASGVFHSICAVSTVPLL